MSSQLETEFYHLWCLLYPDTPLQKEVPLIPKRKFRFDFVHQFSKTAIEINGGNWVNGRHTRASALGKEYEKINLAQMEGYRLFLLNNEMITPEWLHKIYESIKFYSVKECLVHPKLGNKNK